MSQTKPRRFRKQGLWFSTTRAEIEEVTKAHKKPCGTCGEQPTGRRLKVTKGSGRHMTTEVYCCGCGRIWIAEFGALANRAGRYLRGELESVRDPNG